MDMLNVYHLHKGLSTERNAQMFAYYIRAYPYLGPFPPYSTAEMIFLNL